MSSPTSEGNSNGEGDSQHSKACSTSGESLSQTSIHVGAGTHARPVMQEDVSDPLPDPGQESTRIFGTGQVEDDDTEDDMLPTTAEIADAVRRLTGKEALVGMPDSFASLFALGQQTMSNKEELALAKAAMHVPDDDTA